MAFKVDDRRGQLVLDVPQRQSPRRPSRARVGDRRPLEDASRDSVQLRAPIPQNRAPTGPHVEAFAPGREDSHVEHAGDEHHDEPRKSMLRRHPLAFLGALVLLVVLLPAGYLYCDYASHFESTDDAFIAARQFTIAPKVPGYLTAVPVTDNEHVVAGQVIARIDDRDYRNALTEARAQVAAARAWHDGAGVGLTVNCGVVGQGTGSFARIATVRADHGGVKLVGDACDHIGFWIDVAMR